MSDKETIQQLSDQLKQINEDNRIFSDNYLKQDKKFILSHSTEYDKLLKIYVNKVKTTMEFKSKCIKPILFCSALILLGILAFFCFILWKTLQMGLGIEMLTVIVPALISFLTIYIAIPKIIVNYLFNDKEEEYMTKIIENMQDYDKFIRQNHQDLQNNKS